MSKTGHIYRKKIQKARKGGKTSPTLWRAMVRACRNSCMRCATPFSATFPPTRDHIIPLKSGGTDSITNVQPLCKPCNNNHPHLAIDYRPRGTVDLAYIIQKDIVRKRHGG